MSIQCLEKYQEQEEHVDKIFVVDNASTDGTYEMLEKWVLQDDDYNKEVITLEQNMGGAGGFYAGMKMAYEQGFEWIMVADDDAFPRKETITKIKKRIVELDDSSTKVAAISTAVYTFGKPMEFHRKRLDKKILKHLKFQYH